MATLAQITELESNPLNGIEKEIVRQILGISGKAGSATYVESEARFELLTAPQRQLIRGLLLDYDDIGVSDTTKVIGGNKGINLDPQRDKQAIANDLRRILYPTTANDSTDSTYTPVGTLKSVSVNYNIGPEDGYE